VTARKFVVIVPDGAADRHRPGGRSPLEAARTPHMDRVAREGVSGRMRTLYPDLPRESLVAQLGMLGWAPHRHYPGGRASCELLALAGVGMDEGDLAFRANLVRMDGPMLASYNADYLTTAQGAALAARLREGLGAEFPEIDLHHNSDFRTVMVVRGARAGPSQVRCPEPHESHGATFDIGALVEGVDARGRAVAAHINAYLTRAAALLAGERANALFPWSPSAPLRLPSFAASTGFSQPAAAVGAMDFLAGMARAGGMHFCRVGNGRPDTDYAAKGAAAVRLLEEGFGLVFVHVNAPDEAAHMGDTALKIHCLEQVDAGVVGPVVEHFRRRSAELGGVMVVPDHYTNSGPELAGRRRIQVHSMDPVPFALWNGHDRDGVDRFGEAAAAHGLHARTGLTHMDLLALLGAVPPRAHRRDVVSLAVGESPLALRDSA
jgi:2,3-bisphosphoglycerate-independent phosphoglycerate mutase